MVVSGIVNHIPSLGLPIPSKAPARLGDELTISVYSYAVIRRDNPRPIEYVAGSKPSSLGKESFKGSTDTTVNGTRFPAFVMRAHVTLPR
ncbi:hypothetical protein MYCOZU1_02548 [Mycobacterium intracellulare subsp. chimaera]|nr:hypothetical protein MYCODSM44623_02425 [Mycobacterium intracellulare subsp. chimaera]ASL20971.1 hypothetical protein MYCOZU1_02548 [Mycobacterium intracellulare subsp. chimaera]